MKRSDLQILVLLVIMSIGFTHTSKVNAISITDPKDYLGVDLLPEGTLGQDWSLKEILTGSVMTFSSFEGKVVLIDFFATWCDPCKLYIPTLQDIRAAYSTSQLVMISLDTDPGTDSEATVKTFAEDEGISWYVFRDTETLSTFYQITSIPTTYIFNSDLRVAYAQSSVLSYSELSSVLNSLIESPQQPATSSGSGDPPGFWEKYWYIFMIIGIFLVIGVAVFVQRQKVITHNKKVRQQKIEEKQKRSRKRWR